MMKSKIDLDLDSKVARSQRSEKVNTELFCDTAGGNTPIKFHSHDYLLASYCCGDNSIDLDLGKITKVIEGQKRTYLRY